MDLKSFSKKKVIAVVFLIIVLFGAIFAYQKTVPTNTEFSESGPVIAEISGEEYEAALQKEIQQLSEMESDENTEEPQKIVTEDEAIRLLSDSQYCAVQICKNTEGKTIPFSYHAKAIAKKDGNAYIILDDTVIDQTFETQEGVSYESVITEAKTLDNGTLRVSARGVVSMKPAIHKHLKALQSDFEYRKNTRDYAGTVGVELMIEQ